MAGRTRQELIVRQAEGGMDLLLRLIQRLPAVERRAVERQRLFGFLERREHDGIEGGERARLRGPGLAHPGACAGHVGKRPADGGADAPGPADVVVELGQLAGGAAVKADQVHRRIQLGGGHADLGRGGGETPLGLADIGPALEQRRAVAHRNERVEARRRGA